MPMTEQDCIALGWKFLQDYIKPKRTPEDEESHEAAVVNNMGTTNCPSCGCVNFVSNFNDEMSLREAHISGICEKCWTRIFGEED